MSNSLVIALLIYSIIWFGIVWNFVKKGKIAIKYGIVWFGAALAIFFVSVLPGFMTMITNFFGFKAMSNLIIAFLITLLMTITLILTIIVTTQKKQIKLLIQEFSLLKSELEDHLERKE